MQESLELTLRSAPVSAAAEMEPDSGAVWDAPEVSGCCAGCTEALEVLAELRELLDTRLPREPSSADSLVRLEAEIRSRLQEGAGEARSVVQLMEEVLNRAVDVADQTAMLQKEGLDSLVTKLEELGRGVAERAAATMAQVEKQAKRVDASADHVLQELRSEARWLGWRPWGIGGSFALAIVLLLTLLRPGWMMSAEQRRALRVGEAVVYTYSRAKVEEQQEIRRVMRWRDPEPPDSAASAPMPDGLR